MKNIARALLLAAAISSPAWAQQGGASKPADDHLVQMRLDIQAARKEYDRKVKEAKGVYDEAKQASAKERDTAIAAARAKAGQK
jgi:hypothetical protein